MTEPGWTLDELTQRVEQALAEATREGRYPGPRDGRARELPDRRAIRWYTTIGLVDRPLAVRGRTALYGPRHLRQLVAIKFRQAAGRTIAEIQEELTGIDDTALSTLVAPNPATPALPPGRATPGPANRKDRFWTALSAPSAESAAEPDGARQTSVPIARVLTPIGLPGGVVLMIPAAATAEDLAAIAAAAEPLLDLLAARGLTHPTAEHRR